jgi:hypothetical protein
MAFFQSLGIAASLITMATLAEIALHSLILYSDMPPPRSLSSRLAQAIFEPNLYLYK